MGSRAAVAALLFCVRESEGTLVILRRNLDLFLRLSESFTIFKDDQELTEPKIRRNGKKETEVVQKNTKIAVQSAHKIYKADRIRTKEKESAQNEQKRLYFTYSIRDSC